MSLRIGADVGGTFTDVVLEDNDGQFVSAKVLTTHDAPEVGILEGIVQIAGEAAIRLEDVEQIIHGTTLATNALIERRGARTALVTTNGFRDVIETGPKVASNNTTSTLFCPDHSSLGPTGSCLRNGSTHGAKCSSRSMRPKPRP